MYSDSQIWSFRFYCKLFFPNDLKQQTICVAFVYIKVIYFMCSFLDIGGGLVAKLCLTLVTP